MKIRAEIKEYGNQKLENINLERLEWIRTFCRNFERRRDDVNNGIYIAVVKIRAYILKN